MIISRGVQPTDVILLLFILMEQKSVDSLIVQGPSDTTAMSTESTYFNCSTSIRPIDKGSIIWFHFPLDGGGQRNYVYDDGRIMTNYKNRFDIDIDLSSGRFNLLILRLESKDAGRYECRDDVHADLGASAELTVLESNLVCESDNDPGGVVGPTQCEWAITPNEVQLSCSVTYNGKNAPQIVWKKAGNSSILNWTSCVTNYNRVTCNIKLTANLQLSRSVYNCELTTQQYNCSLEIPPISYVFSGNATVKIAIYEEVKCSANSSQSCSYKWKWFSGSDSLTESNDQTLKPTRVGSHRCEATCTIGNTSCVVDVMFAEVYSTQSLEAITGQQLWYLLPMLLTLILVIAITMVSYWGHNKRHDKMIAEKMLAILDSVSSDAEKLTILETALRKFNADKKEIEQKQVCFERKKDKKRKEIEEQHLHVEEEIKSIERDEIEKQSLCEEWENQSIERKEIEEQHLRVEEEIKSIEKDEIEQESLCEESENQSIDRKEIEKQSLCEEWENQSIERKDIKEKPEMEIRSIEMAEIEQESLCEEWEEMVKPQRKIESIEIAEIEQEYLYEEWQEIEQQHMRVEKDIKPIEMEEIEKNRESKMDSNEMEDAVRVHIPSEGPLKNFSPVEDDICSALASVLGGASAAESKRIFELVQLRLIAAKKEPKPAHSKGKSGRKKGGS